ncbi:MAG: dihydropteroate synthase [Nitrospirota bacterium]
MGPVLRISGHGALAITLKGLTADQTAALVTCIRSPQIGAGHYPAPISLSSRECAVDPVSELVLTGTPDQLRLLFPLLAREPRIPASIAQAIESLLDNYLRSDYKIDCRGKILDLGGRTHIMGILNVTPDSFSDGGQYAEQGAALEHAREMVFQGADIIDIGGESTRPGAEPLTEEEEVNRIIPVIERLSNDLRAPISVDTYKSSVAKKALAAGASIVNDISGLHFSPDMAHTIAVYGAAVVIMHIKGTPRDMQVNPVYGDVIDEIMEYLDESAAIALQAGIGRDRIMIDPGIGFGKTLEHNLTILERLDEFRALGFPIVLGTSRKRFIGTVLDIADPKGRIEGTAATVALGIQRGARIVRVHDVGHMSKVARMTDAIVKAKHQVPSTN